VKERQKPQQGTDLERTRLQVSGEQLPVVGDGLIVDIECAGNRPADRTRLTKGSSSAMLRRRRRALK